MVPARFMSLQPYSLTALLQEFVRLHFHGNLPGHSLSTAVLGSVAKTALVRHSHDSHVEELFMLTRWLAMLGVCLCNNAFSTHTQSPQKDITESSNVSVKQTLQQQVYGDSASVTPCEMVSLKLPIQIGKEYECTIKCTR